MRTLSCHEIEFERLKRGDSNDSVMPNGTQPGQLGRALVNVSLRPRCCVEVTVVLKSARHLLKWESLSL